MPVATHEYRHFLTPAGGGDGDRITHRPNDGSGTWADYSTTGHQNYAGSASGGYSPCAHGYSGLYDFTSGMTATSPCFVDSPGPLSVTFSRLHFRGKTIVGANARCDSMTFSGCVFDGTFPNDNLVQVYLPSLFKCSYCTLKPAALSSPPGNDGTAATAKTYPGTPYSSSWQLIAAGLTGVAGQTGACRSEFDHCDIWGNAGIELTGGGSAALPTYFDWCYLHDQADTDWSGGGGYHHDGIGPDSTGPTAHVNVTNCTLATLGTCNAIAYQGQTPPGCYACTVSGCYFAGWELGISLGAGTAQLGDYSVTFTDNVWSAEVPFIYAPMYATWPWNSSGTPPAANTGMLWRRNRWQYLAGDPVLSGTFQGGPAPAPIGWDTSWNGKFWWPSDSSPHDADYAG